MSTLMGFGTFCGTPQEQINEKISRGVLSGDRGMIVWCSIGPRYAEREWSASVTRLPQRA